MPCAAFTLGRSRKRCLGHQAAGEGASARGRDQADDGRGIRRGLLGAVHGRHRRAAVIWLKRANHVHEFLVGSSETSLRAIEPEWRSSVGVSFHRAGVLSQKICAVTLPLRAVANNFLMMRNAELVKELDWAWHWISPGYTRSMDRRRMKSGEPE
jgi:hypothetical protein